MITNTRILNFLAFLFYPFAAASQNSTITNCGLYLAISSTSTPDETKWGLYTAKHIPAHTTIGFPEVGLISHQIKGNNYLSGYDEDSDDEAHEQFLQRCVDFLEEMIWVAASAGGKFELPTGQRAVAAIPGAGVLAAFHPKLTNADWDSRLTYTPPAWGIDTGVPHLNRGAVSPFYHATVKSTVHIVAGAEIFLDYGENWATDEEEDALTAEDYLRIDETVEQMIGFFEKHKESLDDDAKKRIFKFITHDVMKAAVGNIKARRVVGVLPPHPDELMKVKTHGGALKFSEPETTRSLEWLQENGMCVDNIRPGPSTISHAGRGAFATRAIAKDGLVAPVPLLHIPEKEVFDMHVLKIWQDNEYMRESEEVVNQQLAVNYMYGHPESSLLFLPTAPTVGFINHHEEPNAKLVWSHHSANERHWFDLSPSSLLEEENMHLGLLMEIVATRDIAEGEEIFIDYGPEWKAAFDEHTRNWLERVENGEVPAEWPLRAVDMMDQFRSNVFKTEEELRGEPYPETVILKAFLTVPEEASGLKGTLEEPKPWGGIKPYSHSHLRDCVIVSRQKHESLNTSVPYRYTVRWTSPQKDEVAYVKDVPHEAFVFVDAPLAGDQFFDGSFRHYIGIPDDIFPQGPWRNRVLEK